MIGELIIASALAIFFFSIPISHFFKEAKRKTKMKKYKQYL